MKFEKRNFLNKKSKAQQLVEFLLVAPFLVIFFGILTEYAYALNVSLVLQNGVKTVSANMYAKIKPSMSESEIKQELLSELSAYMTANNAPNKAANGLSVDYVEVGNSAVILAGYKYICAFTLPTIYFHILPEEFNFKASATAMCSFFTSIKKIAAGKRFKSAIPPKSASNLIRSRWIIKRSFLERIA